MDKKKQNLDDTKSEADLIWEEIKDKKIQVFSLPEQTVSAYCTPTSIEPSKLYLLSNASSLLPVLETALDGSFSVDRFERFITVSRKK